MATQEQLKGKDTQTVVTIIDDDKPGNIYFEESKGAVKCLASEEFADIKLIRKNGSDGKVTVTWETVQLDDTDHTATNGVDFEAASGEVCFLAGETEQVIQVKIIAHADETEPRDETFGIKLTSITPEAAKLSKRNF